MNYSEFIQDIINSRGMKLSSGYKEVHHIKPKCLGGDDSEDNLIELTGEEHFLAHKLLALENPDNPLLVFAWSMMAYPKSQNQERNHEITPEEYSELKRLKSKAAHEAFSGLKRTPEQREHYRQSKLGDKNPMTGKTGKLHHNFGKHIHSEEARKIMSNKKQGKYDGENNPS